MVPVKILHSANFKTPDYQQSVWSSNILTCATFHQVQIKWTLIFHFKWPFKIYCCSCVYQNWMYILMIDITLHYSLGGRKQLLLMGVGSSPGIGAQDICGPLGCNVLLGSHLPSPASITPHLWCWVWPGLIIDILGPDSHSPTIFTHRSFPC